MIEYLSGVALLLILNSLACVGFHRSTEFFYHPDAIPDLGLIPDGSDKRGITNDSKNVFWFIRYYAEKWLGWYAKPVCSCVRCMASLWSVIFWPVMLWFNPLSLILVFTYLLYIPAMSVVNDFVNEKLS